VEFQDFQFTMLINAASVPLILACATGQHIPDGLLTARKSGGDQQTFYKVTFTDVLVSSFAEGGFAAGDSLPTDSFSINFAKIEWEYSRQNPDGTLDAPIRGGWDLKANTKF
jgi:type VI secretion system secreted protein Hcp